MSKRVDRCEVCPPTTLGMRVCPAPLHLPGYLFNDTTFASTHFGEALQGLMEAELQNLGSYLVSVFRRHCNLRK